MKTSMKLFTCGTTALFAAALTLQAQTSGAGTSGTTGGTTAGSSATSNLGSSSQTMPSSSPQSNSQFGTSSATPSTGSTATAPQSSGSQFGSSSANSTSSTQFGTAPANPSTPTGANSGFNSSTSNTGTQSFNATGNMNSSTNANLNTSTNANMNSSAATTTQSTYAAGGLTTVNEGQVTTFVQQFDTLAPDVVVQRVSSDLGDLACSQDTVQNLVEALHSGRSVTITSDVNGQQQSATFNPEGAHMGYGEAYLTLAMAAQELRNAGVTTCATPEQWNAVLMGGPLNVTSTSTSYNSSASASGSRQVQGIVALRKQGQGWGQIAQTNNVQLGQVINSNATSQTGAQSGFSNTTAQPDQSNLNANEHQDNGKHKGQKKHWWSRDKDKDNHKDSSSTHADDSAKPDNK